MEVELDRAEQTALTEADAVNAAKIEEKDYVPSGEEDNDSSEVDSLLGEFSVEDAEETADNTKSIKRNADKQWFQDEKHSQRRTSERSLHFPIFERKYNVY